MEYQSTLDVQPVDTAEAVTLSFLNRQTILSSNVFICL
jgi:hypothetical protein